METLEITILVKMVAMAAALTLASCGGDDSDDPTSNPNPNPPGGTHVPVTNITDLPSAAVAGTALTLTGTVVPNNATNKTIAWSVQSAGTTEATITGDNKFNATKAGKATVRATIANGLTASSPYTKDFDINVSTGTPSVATYTVTFNANGGTPTPAAQTVEAGAKATLPTKPAKTDYMFLFWSLDGLWAYDFNTPVNTDITLTALWQYDPATLTVSPEVPGGVLTLGADAWAAVYSTGSNQPAESRTAEVTPAAAREWCTVEKVSATGGQFTLRVKANPSATARTPAATVTFSAGSASVSFRIEQKGIPQGEEYEYEGEGTGWD